MVDLTDVPVGTAVQTRESGRIQSDDGSLVASIFEYYYIDVDTGEVRIAGYEVTFRQNDVDLATLDARTEFLAIQMAQNYVSTGTVPSLL